MRGREKMSESFLHEYFSYHMNHYGFASLGAKHCEEHDFSWHLAIFWRQRTYYQAIVPDPNATLLLLYELCMSYSCLSSVLRLILEKCWTPTHTEMFSRSIEWRGLKWTLKITKFQFPCSRQEQHCLVQVAQSPIQLWTLPEMGHPQLPWKYFPVLHHLCEKFLRNLSNLSILFF